MLAPLLMGLVAGSRSMTPLAAVSFAKAGGALRGDNGAPHGLAHPAVLAGAAILAIGELFGDKMHSAPDRIVAPGIAARVITGAVAGAALAPKRQRLLAMFVGAGAAVAASYVTFNARMAGLRRVGQMRSGLIEDVLVLVSAAAIASTQRRALPPPR